MFINENKSKVSQSIGYVELECTLYVVDYLEYDSLPKHLTAL